jgi:hypothetical protein
MANGFHIPLETVLYRVKTVTRLLITLPFIFPVFQEFKILRNSEDPSRRRFWLVLQVKRGTFDISRTV